MFLPTASILKFVLGTNKKLQQMFFTMAYAQICSLSTVYPIIQF